MCKPSKFERLPLMASIIYLVGNPFAKNELTTIFTFQIGQVSDVLKAQGAQLILPVALLHAAAFALGYWVSKISFGESTSRTISIECGMQVILPPKVLRTSFLKYII